MGLRSKGVEQMKITVRQCSLQALSSGIHELSSDQKKFPTSAKSVFIKTLKNILAIGRLEMESSSHD